MLCLALLKKRSILGSWYKIRYKDSELKGLARRAKIFMGTGAENLGDFVWTDPVSRLPVRDGSLSAGIENETPGVRGDKLGFGPLIEGHRISNGMPVQAFFMNDPEGQPFVGIREVPTPPGTD